MHYAAYGSNLHPRRLQLRLPSARFIGTASLPDYSLRFHKRSVDGSGKCSIGRGGDGVHCAIYDLSRADFRRLDGIEGTGMGYDRITVDVPGAGPCATYQAEPAYLDERLQPYDWYKEMVVRGCRFHGFPEAYVERIAALAAVPDPDQRRSEDNWAIARSLAQSQERLLPQPW